MASSLTGRIGLSLGVFSGKTFQGNNIEGGIKYSNTIQSIYITGYKRVCYYSNWSQHRQGTARFVPSDIDPFLCTHLVYSFAELPFGIFELTKWELNDFEL